MKRLLGVANALITVFVRPERALFPIIVLSLCIFFSDKLLSQPRPPSNLLPTIISPSPEVAAFARFGNYEVNLFNGSPNISIPLYEINVGKLKVPITLTYNASGIRVNDIPSNVGTGWSLNAGGAITRKVMGGMPDEYNVAPANVGYFGYLNGGTVKNLLKGSSEELDYFREITDRHRIDAEPDIFSYNLPGRSGKFIFSQEDNLKPFLIPYEPLDISHTIIGSSTMNLGITDESGINYQFNDLESSTYSLQSTITSAWLLSKMTSSNGQDVISFNYSNASNLTLQLPNDNITVIDGVNSYCSNYANSTNSYSGLQPYSPTPGQASSTLYNYNTISQKNLETIVFKNGKVVFQLAPEDRVDLGLTGLKKRMQRILIYNLSGSDYKLIKEIDFYHSYFIRDESYSSTYNSANSKRLKLDSIVVNDGAGARIQVYKFEYNSRTDNYGLPDQNAKAIDYWGYYNGKFQPTLVPRTDISYTPTTSSTAQSISIGANTYGTRDPDPSFMQAGILTKITYPTGGYSLFTYETNQYGTNPPVTTYYAGGLRIKKIESYDGISTTPLTKTYAYGQNECGYGVKNFVLENFYFKTNSGRRYWILPDGTNYQLCASENVRTFLSNPTNDIEPWDAAPVAYSYVTEYIGDGTTNTGKVVYQFENQPDNLLTSQLIGGSPFVLSNHFHRGNVLFKTTYRKNVDNSYSIVAQTENHYSAFPDVQKNYSALSVTHNLYSNGATRFGQDVESQLPPANAGYYDWNGSMEYVSFYYPIQSGDRKVTQTIERVYDQNDPLKVSTTTTNYVYNNFNHQQPTSVTTTTSKNETIKTTYKYPHDFVDQQPYTDMVNVKHIWSPIIEQSTNKIVGATTTFLNSTKTNYKDWGNNIIAQETIASKTLNQTDYEIRLRYHSYDNQGNVTSVSKEGDVTTSYLWGYNHTYPVAQVVGADEATIKGLIDQNVLDNVDGLYTEDDIRAQLSGLRSGLASSDNKALVTTYTYQPLVGMTSQTDPNGRTTYYEYDGLGRLSLVRDQEHNIIKKYCYTYAGQTEACSVNTAPDWQLLSLNCEQSTAGQNTGNQIKVEKDMNPYSATASATRSTILTNDTACPLPAQPIYARLSYENEYTDWDGSLIADMVVRFYSDWNCTQPYEVTDFHFNYQATNSCETTTYNYTDVANTSAYVLGQSYTIAYPNPSTGNGMCNLTYSLTSGSGYIIR